MGLSRLCDEVGDKYLQSYKDQDPAAGDFRPALPAHASSVPPKVRPTALKWR